GKDLIKCNFIDKKYNIFVGEWPSVEIQKFRFILILARISIELAVIIKQANNEQFQTYKTHPFLISSYTFNNNNDFFIRISTHEIKTMILERHIKNTINDILYECHQEPDFNPRAQDMVKKLLLKAYKASKLYKEVGPPFCIVEEKKVQITF
ncbi:22221_t:CDS:2, partial [Dentiscutata erythropus]